MSGRRQNAAPVSFPGYKEPWLLTEIGFGLGPYRLGKDLWRPQVSEATREVRRQNAAKLNKRVNNAE